MDEDSLVIVNLTVVADKEVEVARLKGIEQI
jgi:hypothetical protein